MSENYDKTRVFNPKEEKNTEKGSSNSKNGKKRSNKNKRKKRKFKMIYIIPIALLICAIIFAIYLWAATRNTGPVYGERCNGVVEIETSTIDSVVSRYVNENENVKELSVDVTCKQIKINLKVASSLAVGDAENLAVEILKAIDSELGYSVDEGNEYSNLFGYIDGKQQYDVDFLITNEDENAGSFPSFGTKQSKNQHVVFTRNETKDQQLVDELYEKQNSTEDDAEEASTEDEGEMTEYSAD